MNIIKKRFKSFSHKIVGLFPGLQGVYSHHHHHCSVTAGAKPRQEKKAVFLNKHSILFLRPEGIFFSDNSSLSSNDQTSDRAR